MVTVERIRQWSSLCTYICHYNAWLLIYPAPSNHHCYENLLQFYFCKNPPCYMLCPSCATSLFSIMRYVWGSDMSPLSSPFWPFKRGCDKHRVTLTKKPGDNAGSLWSCSHTLKHKWLNLVFFCMQSHDLLATENIISLFHQYIFWALSYRDFPHGVIATNSYRGKKICIP